jgi:uncharacterized PurR-regulated membrane protein YhhQ (DUF165 family)
MNRKTFGLFAAAGLIATIFAANWALERWGIVPIGFGLMAPAGVYFAGLAFGLRDVVHETLGRWPVLACIAVGAVVSYTVSPTFAVASASAFLFAELADFVVYDRLREHQWHAAVICSNLIGAVIDSALFLWLAFGSLAFIEGQVLAKSSMTLLAVAALWLARRHALLPRHASR